jgi:hypothetical protein
MRSLLAATALAVAMLVGPPARAAEPDAAAGLAVGAATLLAGFAVGGTMMATSHDTTSVDEAGWFALESGFVLAPLAAHAVVGEWSRGALFAAVPAATTLGTIPVFLVNSTAVDHGSLPEQRWMWGLFGVGMFSAAAGVVDVAFAPGRAVRVAPMMGPGTAGLTLGGAL